MEPKSTELKLMELRLRELFTKLRDTKGLWVTVREKPLSLLYQEVQIPRAQWSHLSQAMEERSLLMREGQRAGMRYKFLANLTDPDTFISNVLYGMDNLQEPPVKVTRVKTNANVKVSITPKTRSLTYLPPIGSIVYFIYDNIPCEGIIVGISGAPDEENPRILNRPSLIYNIKVIGTPHSVILELPQLNMTPQDLLDKLSVSILKFNKD